MKFNCGGGGALLSFNPISPATTNTITRSSSSRRAASPFFFQFKIRCSGSPQPLIYANPTPQPRPKSGAKNGSRRRRRRRMIFRCNCDVSLDSHSPEHGDFVVVNFYQFVFIKDPQREVANHLSFLQGLDIHGRIYLNEQGVNAQFSGPSKDALAYVQWLREDSRFSDMLVQVSPLLNGHAFPRLKLRYKPSLVQLEGGTSHLPLLDPSMRATPIVPSEWRRRLKAVCKSDETSDSCPNSNYVLLDVRNGYEWDIGHFVGSQRPVVDCFRSTSFGLSHQPCNCAVLFENFFILSTNQVIASDPLANVDKKKTDILMYCTGGIRCDVYSTILRQQGFENLYTLKGGVSHYLKSEGPAEWVGNLYVFDDRLALSPSAYRPATATAISRIKEEPNAQSFAKCYVCGSQVSELRHRNCANTDCNFLFLCCMNCVKVLRGCCCQKCTTASRLRPVLPENQRYKKWHLYRELEIRTTRQ